MRLPHLSRYLLVAVYLAAVGALTAGVWSYGYRQALRQVAARGQGDLALASDSLVTQFIRYREAAVLLAEHPHLVALFEGGTPETANQLLLEAADRTTALTAFFADDQGRVLAKARSPIPPDLAQTAYFKRAMQGALGAGLGIMPTTGQRAFFFAAPSFGPSGRVRGTMIVVVDIDHVESDWRGARSAVYFSDPSEQVFVTNRSELLFFQRLPGGMQAPDGTDYNIDLKTVAGFSIWEQALSSYVPQPALHLQIALPVIGMRAEALVDVEPARRLAWLQAAAVAGLSLMFVAALLIATERRRVLSEANTVLESRVATRTRDLVDANTALRREVVERQEAEAALKRAQADLVQAGKLSALGQMSAGISHELNQPLMAIRSFADNGVAFLDRDKPERVADNLSRISDMARRMGRIISNLRAFARQETAEVTRVDLRTVLDSVVEMTETRLREGDTVLDYQRPEGPIYVRGGEVRLGQVFVNLITNAVDAMSRSETRRLTVAVGAGDPLLVTVRDTGPGISAPEKIFDPFYSTKSVGADEGMGLGLSISYGLVQSFGGTIRGANVPGGGAEFTVELERWSDSEKGDGSANDV